MNPYTRDGAQSSLIGLGLSLRIGSCHNIQGVAVVLAESWTALVNLEIYLFKGALLLRLIKKLRSNKSSCANGNTITT